MNTYKKNNFPFKKIGMAVVCIAVSAVILQAFGDQAKNALYGSMYPASGIFQQAGRSISGFFSSIFYAGKLNKENNSLSQENQALLFEVANLRHALSLQELAAEAEIYANEKRFILIAAEIVGLDGENDIVTINKGSDDGILEGMPVVSAQKVLYGKVIKPYKNFSQVMLISNENSVVSAKIQTKESDQPSVHGAVKGKGNFSMYFDLVPTEELLSEGDILASSALDGVFPQNLLIGKVSKIDKNDIKPFQSAKIQPFSDIKNVEALFVIMNYKKD